MNISTRSVWHGEARGHLVCESGVARRGKNAFGLPPEPCQIVPRCNVLT